MIPRPVWQRAGPVLGRPYEIRVAVRPGGRGTDLRAVMPAMGTGVHLRILDVPEALARRAAVAAFAEIAHIERQANVHDPDSPLSLVNRLAGRQMVRVGGPLLDVVRQGMDLGGTFQGAFDITALPLLRAWGFGGYRFDRPPTGEDRERARVVVGLCHIEISGDALGLRRAGAGIDLGSIAKGVAIDRAVDVLRRFGVRRALVEAGGDLYALGCPRDAPGWRIGLRHPLRPGWCATFSLADAAVATSGAYESYLDYDGRRCGHVMDPRTGQPAETCLSATVVATSAGLADAAATALFVTGTPDQLPPGTGWMTVVGGEGGRVDVHAGGAVPPWTAVEEGEGT